MYKRERHEVFDRDGWYHTGDRGFMRDGYLFFTGRATEMIKTHGANVSPREVELALEGLPAVAQAYVFGLADPERGERVVAVVVPADPARFELEAVLEELRESVAAYKVPRQCVVLRDDEVPWLASGKPDRVAIHRLLAENLDPSSHDPRGGDVAHPIPA
jgi:acyl-CoA synthetase (AMP-forming)/AMP-acid ligase II